MSVKTTESTESEATRRSAKSLSVDMNDALTRETLAIELVARAIRENTRTRLGAFLTLLSWELEEDRESLVRLMAELGVRPKRGRVVLARLAEKLPREARKLLAAEPLGRARSAPSSDQGQARYVDRAAIQGRASRRRHRRRRADPPHRAAGR